MKTERLLRVVYVLAIFLVGFISAYLINFYSGEGFSINRNTTAPSNYLDAENILVYEDRVVLNLEGARISNYMATGSMTPVFNENANGISVKPINENEIEVGDIISFWREDDLIVHRVIDSGIDSEGIFYITKGDHAFSNDGKIRFGDVEHKLVGLVY